MVFHAQSTITVYNRATRERERVIIGPVTTNKQKPRKEEALEYLP